MWSWTLLVLLACSTPGEAGATEPVALTWPEQPDELGRVRWRRGYEAAQSEARASGRPLLVLFDEVPGCATVLAYGAGPLSDPLVVDAIEESFVPVVVYNNVQGPDRAVLERFGEPTWNNPVVRIVDADGDDVVPRLAGDRRASTLLSRMVSALTATKRTVPDWLSLVEREARSEGHTRAALYEMSCFWSGEQHLGSHPGVLSTQPGFANGREVVQITYDPGSTSKASLDAWAARGESRPTAGAFRGSDRDDRYRIRGTPWAAVPMTPAQAARVNADVGAGRSPARWLSPRQLAIHARAVASGDVRSAGLGRVPLREAFDARLR